MQTIADKSLALAVNTQTIVMSIVDGVKEGVKDRAERLRDEERGVAAVEYAGVLLIVGLIFAGIFALHLPTEVAPRAASDPEPADPAVAARPVPGYTWQ